MRGTRSPGRRELRSAAAAALVAAAALGAPHAEAQQASQDPQAPPAAPPKETREAWPSRAREVPVRYAMTAELRSVGADPSPRHIKGTQHVHWTNTAPDAAGSLYLHLYANAFRNTRSTFFREFLRDGGEVPEDMVFGGIEIQRITLLDRPLEWEFVQPDDGNADDRTVARVKLDEPVEPGTGIALRIEFTTELPSVFRRMGASRDFVMAAQWYPKLGRYLGREAPVPHLREGWYCHQYHATTEFAADFADYDVELTVPLAWKTGATGSVESPWTDESGGRRGETWRARSVVDFAWTASPRFLESKRTIDPAAPAHGDVFADPVASEIAWVRRLLDLSEEESRLPPVTVRLLLQPEHAAQAERHFEAARAALGMFGAWLGPYPYPELTIVDPAYGGESSGGMEYPQLVTAGTEIDATRASQQPEHVIVHEIGHQWFMNLLASNEAEEAWLDEGLNSWCTARVLHKAYGPATAVTKVLGHRFPTELPYTFPGLHAGWPEALRLPKWSHPPDLEAFRLWRDFPVLAASDAWRYRDDPILPARRSYLRNARWDEMVRAGWEYVDRGSYRANAYPRPMLFVETLARTLVRDHGREEGERRLLRALRGYGRAQRFRHPRGEDFLAAFRDHAGLDPAPYWSALAKTTGLLDYAIEQVTETTDPVLAGWTDDGGTKRLVAAGEDRRPRKLRTTVLVRRRGEVVVPVVVSARVSGAEVPVERLWDGVERWRTFTFDGKLREVRIDPDRVFLQDARLSDNAWVDRPNAQPAVKWSVQGLLWLENALTAWGRFF